jgi:hypothetical protein
MLMSALRFSGSRCSVQPHVGGLDALRVAGAVLHQELGKAVRSERERVQSDADDVLGAVLLGLGDLARVGGDALDDGARRAAGDRQAEPGALLEGQAGLGEGGDRAMAMVPNSFDKGFMEAPGWVFGVYCKVVFKAGIRPRRRSSPARARW